MQRTRDQIMLYTGNTKNLDFIILFDVLSVTARSGRLSILYDQGTVTCFVYEGRCVFCCSQNISDYLTVDLVDQLSTDRNIINEIKVFAKSHPHFLMQAFIASDISMASLERELVRTAQKHLFEMLLQHEAEYEFHEDENMLESMSPDPKMRHLFATSIGPALEAKQFDQVVRNIELVPVLKEQVDISTYNKTLNIFILTAVDGQRTVRQIIDHLSDSDSFTIYEGIMRLEAEGIITLVPKDQGSSYPILRGMETISAIMLEIYKAVIPLICADAVSERDDDPLHPLEATLERVKNLFPQLFQSIEGFKDIDTFLKRVEEGLNTIESPKKLMVLKQGLNAYFIELVLHARLALGKLKGQENEENVRGMLSFIYHQGSPNHRTIALMIIELLSLAGQPCNNLFIARNAGAEVAETSEETILDDLVKQGLYLEAVDELFDRQPFRFQAGNPQHDRIVTRALTDLKSRIGDKSTLVRSVIDNSHFPFDTSDIDATDGYILSRLDSPLTIGQVIIEACLPEVLVYRHLDRLLTHGCIALVSEKEAKQPPVGPQSDSPEQRPDAAPVQEQVPIPTGAVEQNEEKSGPGPAEAAKLHDRLKQELIRMKGMLPHEIFELSPDTTREQFEARYQSLKSQYTAEKFEVGQHSGLDSILAKINHYLDEIAETARGYFTVTRAPQAVQPAETVAESESVAVDIELEVEQSTAPGTSPVRASPKKKRRPAKPKPADYPDDYVDREPLWKRIVREHKPDTERLKRQEESHLLYQKTLKAQESGEFSEAIAFLEQAIQLTPDNYSLHRTLETIKAEFEEAKSRHYLQQADKALGQNDLGKAVQLLRKALEKDATKPELYIKLATLLSQNPKNTKEAEYNFRKAIEMEPGNSSFYVGLGRLYKTQGMLKEARDQFQEALRWNKKDSEARTELKLLP
ncbi:tetratricopeptide repeat protein [bacterium]|nr:tetratricopeptide repeat protein [bacterium]